MRRTRNELIDFEYYYIKTDGWLNQLFKSDMM
jgi:hypothetical protein